MKTGTSNGPDGIDCPFLLEGGDSVLRRIASRMFFFVRTTNNVKDECGAGRSSSSNSSSSISNNTQPVIKFQNNVEFVY
jgi:hypothetical protein